MPEGQTVSDRIKWCEAEADRLSASADALRWEAAELIAAELESGKTQRQLAEEIGKHHTHVGFMSRVWDKFGYLGIQGRPGFNGAYQQVKRPNPEVSPESEPEPEPQSQPRPEPRPREPTPSSGPRPLPPRNRVDDPPIKAPVLPPVCREKEIREEIVTRLAFPEKELVAMCNDGLTIDELHLMHEVLRRLLNEVESLIDHNT